jgi:hypothetical protein
MSTRSAFSHWDIEQGQAQPEDVELLTVKRIPFLDAVGMVERGEITDAMSVASILKVHVLALTGRLVRSSP